MIHKQSMGALSVIFLWGAVSLFGQQAAPLSQKDVDSIVQQFETNYTDAFNRRDAKALAALYADNATDLGEHGAILQGRANIEKAFSAALAMLRGKVEYMPKTSVAVTSDVIIIQGASRRIADSGSQPEKTFAYTKVLVRQADGWRLAALQSAILPVMPKEPHEGAK